MKQLQENVVNYPMQFVKNYLSSKFLRFCLKITNVTTYIECGDNKNEAAGLYFNK